MQKKTTNLQEVKIGHGDEIMALGRLERFHEATGQQGSIRDAHGEVRANILWNGSPAWDKHARDGIVDGGGKRPYIDRWSLWHNQPQIIFNHQYRPRAGRIHLTEQEYAETRIDGLYVVISPHIKDGASPNKQWGVERWEQVIAGFSLPVYQLGPNASGIIKGARHFPTATMRHAAGVIEGAALVLTNEGGMHHLAASMGAPAVVVFGAFVPPLVTGYAQHANMAVETEEGYCGRYAPCDHCKMAMASITVDMVKEKATKLLEACHAG